MAERDRFAEATARMERLRAKGPIAIAARYDRRRARVVLSLNTGLEVAFSPTDAQGLEDAEPADLDEIEITPSGLGLHFPKLDADLYLPALLEGLLGSKRWMAARLGERGARAPSDAKTATARANGGLSGGSPKKAVAAHSEKRERDPVEIFCEGVRRQRLVRLLYQGEERLFAPHAVFRSPQDELSVSGIKVANPLDPWREYEIRTYHIAHASDVSLTDYPFEPDTEFSSDQPRYKNGVICAMDLELQAASERSSEHSRPESRQRAGAARPRSGGLGAARRHRTPPRRLEFG